MTVQTIFSAPRTARPYLSALVVLAFAGLCACASTAGDPRGKVTAPPLTPTQQFSIKVQQVPDQVALAVHAEGLSTRQQAAVADFAMRYREEGGAMISLKTPVDAPYPDQAKSMAYQVQTQLEALGVPGQQIALVDYKSGDPRAPILATFERAAAVGPDCSGGWENLTSTNNNAPYHHFGCSLTANIAAQVADPRDFVTPPHLAPGDNTRRQVVLAKYREGKITASDKDEQASGAVSSAVKQ